MLTINEIKTFMSEDAYSPRKRMAKLGQKYYDAEHDILQYRMFYYNADGQLKEDKQNSSVRIPHPFFTELVDQCTQYMLSGDDSFIRSDDPELQTKLDEYFGDDFKSELAEVLTGTQTHGFDYMYAYLNEAQRLVFQHADSLGVVECRAKETSDGCDYVIYYYTDRITKENREITIIQVWDKEQTYYYVKDANGEITLDDGEAINPRPHILYQKPHDTATYYKGFGYIPFVRLENNTKWISSLKPIKPLIDDYDMMSCGLSNNIADFDNPLYVVKGFEGDNLEQLAQNLRTTKRIGVDGDGGVEVHTVDIPYQARQTKMELDEKNIYRFGMGFNSAQLGDGNVTNVVIKSRYALLDLKSNKLEIKLKKFLRRLIDMVLAQINEQAGTDYQSSDVYIQFDREIMTNATDNAQIELTQAQTAQTMVTTLMSLSNVLDDETIIQNICDVLDIDYTVVKDKLPDDPADDLTNAQALLSAIKPAETTGQADE